MTAGLRWRTALVGAGLCCQAAAAAQWTLKTDFENGMRQGWESYPLAQDAGYDPTLDPANYEGRRGLGAAQGTVAHGTVCDWIYT